MASPNNAYLFGTTPVSGGLAAAQQAIRSAFLGVNTTIASAIASIGVQIVTPAAMTNIGVGTAVWINWGSVDQECVSVTATTGSTFTANFTLTHAANSVVTCGLPSLGVSNPWALAGGSFSPTATNYTVVSSALTAAGDANYIPILVGVGGSPNSLSMGTAEDIDVNGGASSLRNPAGFSGSTYTPVIVLQDASFSWWIGICEYAITFVANIGGTYESLYCGSIQTPHPVNYRGVGLSSAVINNGATTVTLTTDISARLFPGQKIYISNLSHNSTSANWSAANAQMTLLSVASGGSTCTLTFTAGTPHAFDAGAMVGDSMPNIAESSSSGTVDSGNIYMTRNNDGTWASYAGQTSTVDTSVITSIDANYNTPMSAAQPGLYAGILDLKVNQTTSGFKGITGFMYLNQEFVTGGINNQDTFFFWDGASAKSWKAFKSSSTCCAIGPIVNPQNTQALPTQWIP